MTEDVEDRRSGLADNRSDFMKRWFAIAISVGFATALSNMPWLKNGIAPDLSLPVDWEQIKQLARLAVAAFATILSWDGYFQSIRKKPLVDYPRFFIDIFLVFIYLILLLTSKFGDFWLFIHATSFLIYCFWDRLSIRIFRNEYYLINEGNSLPSINEVYIGSLSGNSNFYHGPAVTLLWTIYFWSLPLSYRFILSEDERNEPATTFIYAVFVLLGLWAYRSDKSKGFSATGRLGLVIFTTLIVLGSAFVLRAIF